jgi:hypothetical protein
MNRRSACALFAVLLVLCTAAAASAATGLAWDSVVKFSMDGTTPQPGDFTSDFQTASQAATPPPQRGGLFGAINNAVGAATAAMSSLRSGFAQRHFNAGSMHRSDDLAAGTATIVDCQARTISTLDLAKKTYRVTSLDAPLPPVQSSGAARSAPGPLPTDDGSKINIKVTSAALGSKTIEGVQTDGYASTMTTTVTKPTGESQSADMTMTSYLSQYAQPSEGCSSFPVAAAPGAGMPNMAMYQSMMRAMTTPNGDPRITVSASGPTQPPGRFPMFTAIAPKASNGRGGFAMMVENGDVRQVSDADKSIFGVPADFTKIP